MLENKPVLRERLLAAATFAGIALATIMALDFMVTGGFQFRSPRTPEPDFQPFAQSTVDDVQSYRPRTGAASPVLWHEPMALDGDPPPQPAGELAGGPDTDIGPRTADAEAAFDAVQAPSEDELYREIDELYAAQDARAAARAEERGAIAPEPPTRADEATPQTAADGYPSYVEEPAYIEEPWYEDAPAIDEGATNASESE